MSRKSPKIASLIHSLVNQQFDAHYLGYFECFNRQLFFEAHEVLEELWLPQRGQADDAFYKGLIQMAGAFVHVQKRRRGPAIALLKLTRENLSHYPSPYQSLDTAAVIELIGAWIPQLQSEPEPLPLVDAARFPKLELLILDRSAGHRPA